MTELELMIVSLDYIEDKEGVVITFKNGKMAKCKTKFYMNLHGILTDGLKEHKIIARIIDETIDDTISAIPEENTEERDFIDGITNVIVKHVNHMASESERKFNEFLVTLENDPEEEIREGMEIITIRIDDKAIDMTPLIKKAVAAEFKGDKTLFPYIMNFSKGRSYEDVEKSIAERVQFDCRRLEMSKAYLRGLGFTTELKLLEDDE